MAGEGWLVLVQVEQTPRGPGAAQIEVLESLAGGRLWEGAQGGLRKPDGVSSGSGAMW